VLTRDNRLDEMEVLVEAAPASAGAEERAAASAKLATLIKDNIGSSARVTVTEPGGIERSQGKARRVVDKRPKE
jgi:phenylacetate-CoA ligase